MKLDASAPILFFDSGVGGLSVLQPTRAILPNAPIVYAADNAGYPYGTKSEAELAARVPALLGRLVERFRPRLAVIACNTASTIALDHVRAALDLPVVMVVGLRLGCINHARLTARAIEHDGLRLTVRDDGVGLRPKRQPSGGMGMRIMQHRMGLIGGKLEVRDADGGGVVVSCAVPEPKEGRE